MSISIVTRLSAFSVLVIFAGMAQAAPNGKPGPPGKGPGQELLKRFDKNGDGKLDETERKPLMDLIRGRN